MFVLKGVEVISISMLGTIGPFVWFYQTEQSDENNFSMQGLNILVNFYEWGTRGSRPNIILAILEVNQSIFYTVIMRTNLADVGTDIGTNN